VSESTKQKLVYAYNRYCKQHNIQWTKPRYKRVDKLPYVPTEKDIEQLIGGMSKRLGIILRFMMETGCRLGEMWCVEWSDIDCERNIVSINQPEKGSLARNLRVSSRLVALINQLPRKSKYIFRTKDNSCKERILSYFWQKRKETAQKVNNPNLMRINFKSLRHYKATQEYAKTKDILWIKKILGHKNIKNTLVYTHLLEFEGEDSFIVKVASNLEEFTSLLSQGFEFISDYNELKILRKRK
jgi:integrase